MALMSLKIVMIKFYVEEFFSLASQKIKALK
jgi:hypothetical protein